MESCGAVVRIPNWWSSEKPPKPKSCCKNGDKFKSTLGLDTALDFELSLTMSTGEKISKEELKSLLKADSNFVQIKGQWVEVDRDKLSNVLSYWNKIEKITKDGLTFAESLRLIAGGGTHLQSEEEMLQTNIAD